MLAFGCMRFTKENGKINLEKAEAEILEAIKLGVNYFDTAYIYSGSEEAIGKIFEKKIQLPGARIYIADKLPALSDQVCRRSGKKRFRSSCADCGQIILIFI